MKNIINVVSTFVFLFFFALNVSPHDSHTHKAPWVACEEKNKAAECSYKNGTGDFFKGSCQSFQEILMCVRSEPIIYAKDLVKQAKKVKNKSVIHSHP